MCPDFYTTKDSKATLHYEGKFIKLVYHNLIFFKVGGGGGGGGGGRAEEQTFRSVTTAFGTLSFHIPPWDSENRHDQQLALVVLVSDTHL